MSNRELESTALEIGEWVIGGNETSSYVAVVDKKGATVARVPNRPDDLDIARAISKLPEMRRALELFRRAGIGNSTDFEIQRQAFALLRKVQA